MLTSHSNKSFAIIQKLICGLFVSRNILLDEINNSILVADVGEAQLANKLKTLTKRGGTSIYMAPERLFGDGENSSSASDVW